MNPPINIVCPNGKTIYVMKRKWAIDLFGHNGVPNSSALISISCQNEYEEPIHFDGKHVLHLHFADTDDKTFPGAMSNADAKAICEFIESLDADVKSIYVHCQAGQSRSAGVGAALVSMFGGSSTKFFHCLTPNMYVYWHVLKAWNISRSTNA